MSGIWKSLSIDEKYAMMDMLQMSVGKDQRIYIAAKIKGKDTQYYNVRQHTGRFRILPKESNIASIRILFEGDVLYKESRLLRYLLKNKEYLYMWLKNRAKQNPTRGMSTKQAGNTISILDGEALSGFGFNETEQGSNFWVKIYAYARKEEGV